MKIIKVPVFKEMTCNACKTVFIPEATDNLEFVFKRGINANPIDSIYTNCPVCLSRIRIPLAEDEDEL